MCLEVKNKRVYIVKDKPKVCYKVVNFLGRDDYKSIYKGSPINFRTVTHAKDYYGRKLKDFYFWKDLFSLLTKDYIINAGLHGFISKKEAIRFEKHNTTPLHSHFKIIKMVLPVGTKYCTGIFSVYTDHSYKAIVAAKAIYKKIK